MSGGGSSGGDSRTENIPWAGQQGFLRDIFGEARSAYDAGELGALGTQSPYTTQAQDLVAQRALAGGSGLTGSATDLAGQTIGGDFLSQSNPYFQDAIAYSQQPVIDAFNEQIAPGVDATFAGTAGGLGSGAYAAARNRAEDTLARNLAGAATQAGYQNYADERTRQQQALALAPGLDQAGYADLDRLAGVGAQQDARSQAEADQAFRGLQQYSSLIYGAPTFSTSTTTQNSSGGGIDPLTTGLGAALTLSSLFACDRRLKTDIRRVGSLDTGEGVYTFRYRGEDPTVHIGVMAQEIEENHPDAVAEVAGVKMVNYGELAHGH